MEDFAGKWKVSKIVGADDYFTAIGHADMAKDMYNINEIEVDVEGKTVTSITRIEGKEPRKDVITLDQTMEHEGAGGIKIISKAYMDGNKFRQEGTAADDQWSVVRYIKDDACVSEITSKGSTMILTMVRL